MISRRTVLLILWCSIGTVSFASPTSAPATVESWTTFVSSCSTDTDNDEIVHSGGWHGGRSPNPQHTTYLQEGIVKDRVPPEGTAFVAHTYVAKDPLHHFSVLPPLHGCGTGSTPGEASTLQVGGCDVATNAGFFVPPSHNHDHDTEAAEGEHTYDCIGPLVSNQVWAHDDGRRHNVMFGFVHPTSDTVALRRAHNSTVLHSTCEESSGSSRTTLAVGYLDDAIVKSTRWSQLIAGVGWLVRDGELFLEQSMRLENATAQRSGSLDRFRSIRAARLGLGVRRDGSLLVVAVDGSEPDWEGVTLDDLAAIMLSMGAWQAINLDGGGSVSVFHGTDDVVNVPSDVCPNVTFPKFRCPRKVSSVLCLHGSKEGNTEVSRTIELHSHHRLSTKFKLLALVGWLAYCLGVACCCWVPSQQVEYTSIPPVDYDADNDTGAAAAAVGVQPAEAQRRRTADDPFQSRGADDEGEELRPIADGNGDEQSVPPASAGFSTEVPDVDLTDTNGTTTTS